MLFVVIIIYLTASRLLIPGVVIIGSFILFVLWLTGLIKTSIELWGPEGSVNANCVQYVQNQPFSGQSINTLAWLAQDNICRSRPTHTSLRRAPLTNGFLGNCWKAIFSLELVGTVFLLWLMVMAYQVHQDNFD